MARKKITVIVKKSDNPLSWYNQFVGQRIQVYIEGNFGTAWYQDEYEAVLSAGEFQTKWIHKNYFYVEENRQLDNPSILSIQTKLTNLKSRKEKLIKSPAWYLDEIEDFLSFREKLSSLNIEIKTLEEVLNLLTL